MEKNISGKVLKTWEETQESAQEIISQKLGFSVIVGDDGIVWREDNEFTIGTLGWKEENVGGVTGLSEWYFIPR